MSKHHPSTRDGSRVQRDGIIESDFRFLAGPTEREHRFEAERTYYQSGELRSERIKASQRTTWADWEHAASSGSETVGGCLWKIFTFYIAGISFIASALVGLWIFGGIGGAAVGLLLWVLAIIVFDAQ